ncbi:hypothetical protein ACIBQ6_20910 [Nonomuraea sp. NPDC049655]
MQKQERQIGAPLVERTPGRYG